MDQFPYYYLFLALLLPLLLLLKLRKPHKHGQRLPPGPWQLPVIGGLHHLLGAHPHRALRDLSRRHGPLMLLRLGEVPALVVSSPAAAEEVMKTHDLAFASRYQSPTMQMLAKEGQGIIFAPYGEHWRQMRKICITELLSAKRVQSFRRIREEEAAHLVSSIVSSPLVNLSERLAVFFIDSAMSAIFGSKLADRDAFLRKFEEGAKIISGFGLRDLFPSSRLARLVSAGSGRRTERHRREVDRLMDGTVRPHEERKASGGEEDKDLMDVLLRLEEDGALRFSLTPGVIKAVLTDIFGAGSETSATTLKWAMAELMRNPKVMEKAQSETRRVFAGQSKVTEEALNDLKYLKAVIKETLRLHPPAPLIPPRECREECRILGYDVPKGTTVLINVWAIGRDPKYWKDPEEFVPERFENSAVDFKGTHFEYLPFGAGRRICPGMAFAQASMEVALANLLYHFDWALPEGIKPEELDMTEASGLNVLRRKSDLWLRATLRIPFAS